jgi:chromate transporter
VEVWLRVASLSFGGPAGQIAVMHRILVEEKRWVSEARFLHALNYCMLLPGPEAQQLATYIGWLMHRTLGGIIAGGLFVVPGIIAIMALSYVYAGWGNVPVIVALFFGLKAAVLAIVVEALVRIGKRALKNRMMIALAAIAFVGIFFFNVPFPIIVFGAAIIGFVAGLMGLAEFEVSAGHGADKGKPVVVDDMLGEGIPEHARPTVARALAVSAIWLALWLIPVIVLLVALGSANVFSQIAVFFSKMAVVTFGGAYAVLAYVAQQAVEHYGWLKPGEMLDGLGMAETTPGPLIMVLQFVGFMAAYRDPGSLAPMMAGTLGGLLATWVTFTLLSVDFPRGAVRRDPARQQGAQRRALRHHRGGGRRGFEPRHLVRDPQRVSRDRAGARIPVVVRRAKFRHRRSVGSRSLRCGRHRDLSVQGRHDPDTRGVLHRGDRSLSRGSDLMSGRAGLAWSEDRW